MAVCVVFEMKNEPPTLRFTVITAVYSEPLSPSWHGETLWKKCVMGYMEYNFMRCPMPSAAERLGADWLSGQRLMMLVRASVAQGRVDVRAFGR